MNFSTTALKRQYQSSNMKYTTKEIVLVVEILARQERELFRDGVTVIGMSTKQNRVRLCTRAWDKQFKANAEKILSAFSNQNTFIYFDFKEDFLDIWYEEQIEGNDD